MTIAACSGCVYTRIPDLPKLSCPEVNQAQRLEEKPVQCPEVEPVSCPGLPMPEPIPATVHLTIENGHVEADAGGEKLIRNYAATRKAVKRLWPD